MACAQVSCSEHRRSDRASNYLTREAPYSHLTSPYCSTISIVTSSSVQQGRKLDATWIQLAFLSKTRLPVGHARPEPRESSLPGPICPSPPPLRSPSSAGSAAFDAAAPGVPGRPRVAPPDPRWRGERRLLGAFWSPPRLGTLDAGDSHSLLAFCERARRAGGGA